MSATSDDHIIRWSAEFGEEPDLGDDEDSGARLRREEVDRVEFTRTLLVRFGTSRPADPMAVFTRCAEDEIANQRLEAVDPLPGHRHPERDLGEHLTEDRCVDGERYADKRGPLEQSAAGWRNDDELVIARGHCLRDRPVCQRARLVV